MTISLDSLGFSLYPVKTRDGSRIFRLETAFKLVGEFPFDIFVEETPVGIHIFDEGLTFHNLLSLGLDLNAPGRLRSLRAVVGRYAPVTFTEQGMIEAFGDAQHTADLVVRYISAMIELDQWVFAVFAKQRSEANRVEEAIFYFRRWRPHAKISSAPKVPSLSGKLVQFDFSVDNQFVDILSDSGSSSAAFLRKVAETRIAGAEKVNTLGVVDDSQNQQRAKIEVEIVSSLSPSMLYSQLKTNAENTLTFTATA